MSPDNAGRPIGRLGRWTAPHLRIVVAAWVVVAVGLGVFAPRAAGAVGSRLGGDRLRVRPRAAAHRQELQWVRKLRPRSSFTRGTRPLPIPNSARAAPAEVRLSRDPAVTLSFPRRACRSRPIATPP